MDAIIKLNFSSDSVIIGYNQEDIVSFSLFNLLNTLINKCFGIIISLVGISTNIINCLVFWRQGLRDRVKLCLFSLALLDLSVFIGILLLPAVKLLIGLWDESLANEFVMKAVAYTHGVTSGLRTMSDIISMIIAVDRCLCVLLPLRVTHLIRTRTMAAMMAASFVFLQLSYVVLPLRFTVACSYSNSTNSFEWKIVQTEIGMKYATIWDTVANTLLSVSFPLVNFLIVSSATAITVGKLRSASRWREKTSSGTPDRQAGATKMLVLVSCLYIVTMTPSVVSIITRLVVREFSPYGRYYYTYMTVTFGVEKFSWINNALNFFVYFAQSSTFRRDCTEVLFCGQRGSPNGPHLTPSLTNAAQL